MNPEWKQYFDKLAAAVVDMDEEAAASLAEEAVAAGVDITMAIEQGLSAGMAKVGELYETEEYFIPELLLASDAMYAGLEVLKRHMKEDAGRKKGKVVIGVVEGDTHDIGKNIVKIMLETAGYEMLDLGRDVSLDRFVDTAIAEDAKIIAMATLMTTTMDGMAEVIQKLKEKGCRDKFKVIVGGGPLSSAYAERIGADGYAVNAVDAVKLSGRLLAGA